MKNPLYSLDGLAEYIGASRRTAIRLRDSGAIPSIKIGRLVRFRESDILRFIESGGVPDYKTRRH